MISQIILIVIGGYLLIVNGILGIGLNFGKAKRQSEKVGRGTVRIVYAVIGLIALAFGIITLINPSLLPQ